MAPRPAILVGRWIFLILILFPSLPLFADFKLLDAIEEFGEKRTITPQPTRLKAGPLRLHPSIRATVEYDDNILLEAEDPREDVIFRVNPGVVVDLPIERHQLSVGYEAELENFVKANRQTDQNQNFFVLADLNFPSWYVNVLESFRETSGRSGTTFTSRIPRFDQSIHPKVGYKWKRMTLEASFRHFVRNFRRVADASLDFQLVEWTGVLYFDLLARLKALLEYQVAQIDYQADSFRKGTFQQARVGLEGEIFPNFFLEVRLGPQFRNYKIASEPNFNSWVAALGVEYQFRENLKFALNFSREAVEATFQNVNFYKEHSAGLGLEYEIHPKWILFSEARYYRHDYAERATVGGRTGFRHDDHVSWEGGIRYLPVEWLEFEALYQYRRRDSDFSSFDYTDNLISFTSSLAY